MEEFRGFPRFSASSNAGSETTTVRWMSVTISVDDFDPLHDRIECLWLDDLQYDVKDIVTGIEIVCKASTAVRERLIDIDECFNTMPPQMDKLGQFFLRAVADGMFAQEMKAQVESLKWWWPIGSALMWNEEREWCEYLMDFLTLLFDDSVNIEFTAVLNEK